jgi:predicted secreted protein
MDDQKIYFEQIPAELKKKVAEQEKGGNSEGRGAKRAWQDIAEEVIKERDPNRLVKLVGELNNALDAERHRQPSKAGPPPCE